MRIRTSLLSTLVISFLAVAAIHVSSAQAQYQVSGLLNSVLRNTSSEDATNKTFHEFSNFDFLRTRIFFDAKVADNATVFTQILVDNTEFQLYGAYLRLSNLAGPALNLHVGLIPNTVGIWGPRTYSNRNPLIGTPMLYNYHTAVSAANFQSTRKALYESRGKGPTTAGLPMIYDACWNTGVDVFGSVGMIDWSVAALSGSVSNPTVDRAKAVPQMTAKMAFYFSPIFSLTFSGYAGPYLLEIPESYSGNSSKDINDYLNMGAGASASYALGYLQVFAEAFAARWQHPVFGNLDAFSGYIDAKYKLAPQWYVAGRAGLIRFDQIDFGPEYGTTYWDFPLNRYEFGVGHNLNRSVTIKLVGQIVVSTTEHFLDDQAIAIQFATKI